MKQFLRSKTKCVVENIWTKNDVTQSLKLQWAKFYEICCAIIKKKKRKKKENHVKQLLTSKYKCVAENVWTRNDVKQSFELQWDKFYEGICCVIIIKQGIHVKQLWNSNKICVFESVWSRNDVRQSFKLQWVTFYSVPDDTVILVQRLSDNMNKLHDFSNNQ